MIQGAFSIGEQRKVSRLRYSKSQGTTVIDNGNGVDIKNTVKVYRIDGTNLGLSNKEKRDKVSRTDGGVITVGEVMTGGIEVHNFNSNISLNTTTPGKRENGNDNKFTNEKTITKSVFIVGGATKISTNKFQASDNLEDDDESSSGSSIATA